MYPSYGATMKQVWVNCSTCALTASTTRGAELPTPVTAMPEPRSIIELPSASTITPPPAATTETGNPTPTPEATEASLRAMSSCDLGPGIDVTTLRICGRVGP